MKDLPKGVYAEGDSLGIDFRYKSIRRREILKPNGVTLSNTSPNRKYAERYRETILAAIRAEKMGGKTFTYAEFFPESKWVKRLSRGKDTSLFGEFLHEWFTEKKKSIEGTTEREWRHTVNRFDKEFGTLKMSLDDNANELTIEVFSGWVERMQSAGFVVKTINNRLAPIRMALDKAVATRKLNANPARLVIVEKTKREKDAAYVEEDIDPFDLPEINKIISNGTGQLVRMVAVGFGTGLRLEELFGLAWEDIDFKAGKLAVNVVITEKQYKRPKTPESKRTISLDKNVNGTLDRLREQYEVTGAMPPIDCGVFKRRRIVFYSDNTKKPWIDDNQLREGQWKTLLKRAQVRYRPPMQMRHTFACLCLINGKSEKWVADYLGHTTTAMVQKHYGKLIKKLQEARKAAGITETPDLTAAFTKAA